MCGSRSVSMYEYQSSKDVGLGVLLWVLRELMHNSAII